MKSVIKGSKTEAVVKSKTNNNEVMYTHMLCRVKAWVVEVSKDIWRGPDRDDLSVISWSTDSSNSNATKTWAKLSKLVVESNVRRPIWVNAKALVLQLEEQFERGTVLN